MELNKCLMETAPTVYISVEADFHLSGIPEEVPLIAKCLDLDHNFIWEHICAFPSSMMILQALLWSEEEIRPLLSLNQFLKAIAKLS